MKIAVTGGSGFLGGCFIELYKNNFDEILTLNSNIAPLNDIDKLLNATQGVDVLIHAAFDHNYKYNIIGINNIIDVCIQNNIKKLIHISSISVYDPDIIGALSRKNQYSKIKDPYSNEKQNIEREIKKRAPKSLNIIILQPSIIYGLGGNWTKYALNVCKSASIKLPNKGSQICNAIYVKDVAKAIYQSIVTNTGSQTFIVSSQTPTTWNEFYKKHKQILEELKIPSNLEIVDNTDKNQFHSNIAVNFLFFLWFKTPLGHVFSLFLEQMKKIRAKKYPTVNSASKLKMFLLSNVNQNNMEPIGITRKIHNCHFNLDLSDTSTELNFVADYTLSDGMSDMKADIEVAIK